MVTTEIAVNDSKTFLGLHIILDRVRARRRLKGLRGYGGIGRMGYGLGVATEMRAEAPREASPINPRCIE